jgi:succinate-semialdehyde dehydrogenase/glutarate-semialdehyde dehydrogenase
MPITSVNPATGQLLDEFPPLSDDEIEARITRAHAAFRRYRGTSFATRATFMRRAAQILTAERDALGRMMTLEMGKPIKAAVAEAEKCAWACRYYADHAEQFLSDETVPTDAALSFIRYEPLGTLLAIMPWNFPFWQVFRFAAPALMAGNVALLKHASNVPRCALAIERIFERAGFDDGAFQTLLIESERVSRLLEDPRIRAVTLTGSEAAGSSVAAAAGRQIKKTVLELGGSDPFVVMPSADLDRAIETAVRARTINNGQSCIAAKRFIVHEAIADQFEEGFVNAMRALRIGDPMDENTDVGPLATAQIVADLDAQVADSVRAGAKLLCGGRRLSQPGNFYEPTVLTDVPRTSPAYKDELFGPVAALFRARDCDHAVAIANDTNFGLGSAVWTNDRAEQQRFINELEAGLVFINGMVASDPRLPFGGVKNSGYGRELSVFGIREFVNIKTVWIEAPAQRAEPQPTE